MPNYLQTAQTHLLAALEALDQSDAPPQIGALVQMGLDKLHDAIDAPLHQNGAAVVATAEK